MLLNETKYNTSEVRKEIKDNEEKAFEILSKIPEAKEALNLLRKNKKLLNRKGYFDYSQDEVKLKARRGVEKMERYATASSNAVSVAEALDKKYSNKKYKAEEYARAYNAPGSPFFDELEILSIKEYSGALRVTVSAFYKGKSVGYGDFAATPKTIAMCPDLIPLSKRMSYYENKSRHFSY